MNVFLQAFAKVNYALEVQGMRDDGYHEVSTVMQSISLADKVEIQRIREGFELSVEPEYAEVGPPEENTVHKARRLLGDFVRTDLPVKVHLRKRIPAGAGLGGGSADAAAALVGLNELFELGLSEAKLQRIGLQVGADVPFCIRGGTALGEGIGEILTSLPVPPRHYLVIAKPASGVQTDQIYRAYDQSPNGDKASVYRVVRALRAGDLAALSLGLGNDLQPVTERLIPEIRGLEERLLAAGALGAAMSGSGTAVYGIFGSETETQAAVKGLLTPFLIGVYEPMTHGVEIIHQ